MNLDLEEKEILNTRFQTQQNLKKKFLWKPRFNNIKVTLKSALAWEKKIVGGNFRK